MNQQAPKTIIPITKRRGLSILPTLDLYILKEFMIPFTALILAFILLFTIGNLFDELNVFLKNNAPISKTVLYFLYRLPENIRFILPLSLLLASMYTMANFGRNMEVTAMRASGISLSRTGGPIYFVALIVTGINFWFNEAMVPDCNEKAMEIHYKVRGKKLNKKMFQYRSRDELRSWFFQYFKVGDIQKDVIVKKYQKGNLPDENDQIIEWEINAKEAFYKNNKWHFVNGYITEYSLGAIKLMHYPNVYFKEISLDGVIDKNGKPFTLSKRIKEGLKSMTETPRTISYDVKEPDDIPTWVIWNILHESGDMAERFRNFYSTIFYSRIAFPWACLLAVFIGIPLAAKNERTGIMNAILSGMIMIIIYLIGSRICLIAGKQGYIPPIIAGLGPTIAFMLYSGYTLFYKKEVA